MSSFLYSKLIGYRGDRLTKEFSYREVSHCYAHFRHQHNEQLIHPSANNNDLINYDLQFKNFVV